MGSVKACSKFYRDEKSSRRRKSVHMTPHRLFKRIDKTSSANPQREKTKAAKDFCFRS
jgi:hypothetical protein